MFCFFYCKKLNLGYQQIADELGLSVRTVENQITKALKILREQMRDYY
ncbi:sigma factor-like helix-turn-helix DNA-binding protein [Anaerophaga thermohalophila]